ncbi:MAG: hypothetical protein KKC76_03910 [Proteobacteria bacterium]|nr:hypothetical protein [Pseudomonadota bacterium]MBU4294455.1 hypothetical protein [Pseudomonadota bacterium]MCG2749162.1 hypothetical protein [Desulfobulbaceae bacterium]
MRKKTRCEHFDFHGVIDDSYSSIFPNGSRLKGNLLPFKVARGAIRPGQVVAVRTADGRTVARFYRNSLAVKVVAIVRAVFLPKRTAIWQKTRRKQ